MRWGEVLMRKPGCVTYTAVGELTALYNVFLQEPFILQTNKEIAYSLHRCDHNASWMAYLCGDGEELQDRAILEYLLLKEDCRQQISTLITQSPYDIHFSFSRTHLTYVHFPGTRKRTHSTSAQSGLEHAPSAQRDPYCVSPKRNFLPPRNELYFLRGTIAFPVGFVRKGLLTDRLARYITK